jgi:hypothetical protein
MQHFLIVVASKKETGKKKKKLPSGKMHEEFSKKMAKLSMSGVFMLMR